MNMSELDSTHADRATPVNANPITDQPKELVGFKKLTETEEFDVAAKSEETTKPSTDR